MIHDGDVHYARNASSFQTYTRIDINANDAMGLGDSRAIGIGTVFLKAKRTDDSDEVTGLTLHDVLHISDMPCNGISYSKLQDANLGFTTESFSALVVMNPSGVPLFHARHEYGLYRVVLDQEPVGESPLAEFDAESSDLKDYLSLTAEDTERIARLGQAARVIQDAELRPGFRPWKDGFEVEC